MLKIFIFTILLGVSFTSTNVFSQDEEEGLKAEPAPIKKKRGVRYSTRKKKILERMRKRRMVLDETIACVEGSKTKKEMKACRKKMNVHRPRKPKRNKKTN